MFFLRVTFSPALVFFLVLKLDIDFLNFKISVKSSDVFLSTKAYRSLSKICNYPLHLGITEAGSLIPGSVKSSIGLGMLLMEGIGDTIRVSLSANPVEEVKVGFEILKSLNLRHKGVNIISCLSCARQAFPIIETVKNLEKKLFELIKSELSDLVSLSEPKFENGKEHFNFAFS